jgi:hypothetical protein
LELHRDKVQGQKLGHALVRVRNRTQLLAAQSLGIVKIQQDRFIDLTGGFLGLGQIVQPANFYRHGLLLIGYLSWVLF